MAGFLKKKILVKYLEIPLEGGNPKEIDGNVSERIHIKLSMVESLVLEEFLKNPGIVQ